MQIEGDPLPGPWEVVLNDGSVIGIWADAYGEVGDYYVFDVLADATADEQADPDLVITSENPSRPERVTVAVARIPMAIVKEIWTRSWGSSPGD